MLALGFLSFFLKDFFGYCCRKAVFSEVLKIALRGISTDDVKAHVLSDCTGRARPPGVSVSMKLVVEPFNHYATAFFVISNLLNFYGNAKSPLNVPVFFNHTG